MSPDECLEPNELVEMMNGRASEADKARIEAHVNQCEDCMQLMIDVGRAAEQASPIADTALSDGSPYSVGTAAEPHGAELHRGEVVDHFQVERLLGRGGMGEVYRAHDVKLGRTVALKLIHPSLMTSSDAKRRFENEARATAKLNHPNIVNIHAVGEHRGRPYVALEYLEGKNLREILANSPPDLQRALGLVLSIAQAVAAAHERGVVHRDLKPENVVIDATGRARVVDFGLARIGAVTEEGVPASVHGGNITTVGGTPLYMAPEQWRLERAGAPADIWAIGVILYELVARQHPFHDYTKSDLEALKHSVEEFNPPELTQRAAVPPFLSQLVGRCLDKNEERRPTASEVVTQLGWALTELAQSASPPVRPPPSSLLQHRRASKRARVVALGAVVVATGAVVWGWRMSRDTTARTTSVSVLVPFVPSAPPSDRTVSIPSPAPSASFARPSPTPRALTTTSSKPPPIDPDDECRETTDCRSSGLCHEQAGACVVKSDADCLQSTNCKTFGNCSMKARRCAPGSAADCKNAQRCASWGMCTLASDRCSAVNAADCRASTECKAKGLCTPAGGWCTAQSDADCQRSQLCQSQGRCRLDASKGQCVQ